MLNIKRLLAFLYYLYFKYIYKDIYKSTIGRWFWKNGNDKYLTKANSLDEGSVVFDVGGYVGVFSDSIIKAYNPYIYIFEPIKEYFDILNTKYSKNPKVTILNVGLSDRNEKSEIIVSGESSSLMNINNTKEIKDTSTNRITLIKISEAMNKYKIDTIDLLSINIEGSEYKLLEAILKEKIINKINLLQVQFHNNVVGHEAKRNVIIEKIQQTHKIVFSFPYVWERFEKKHEDLIPH